MGTYTDDPNDDFMMPTGEIAGDANTFGNSWKSEYSCQDQVVETQHPCDANPAARPAAEKICSAIKGDLFKREFWGKWGRYFDEILFRLPY